ncbi:efflux transporter periplasmic adaptor subunit [Rhodoplanes roseus]|uniref:Efflux transporter periplasmic adaptor subunit n=2 Tax=Rhodoplanes roseus TaxID=29409 RepID=A0A327L3P6_9BRAD|nr:efflux RND transporter periplasmic adaptor subunit [Rhodoplanes roseus]RAI44453.1 efflux transporter periplasmic adaptor subunit [Rhodoplanes roseus]
MAGVTWLIVTQSGFVPGGGGAPTGPPGMARGGPGGGGRFGRDMPVPVLAAAAKTADVPVYFDGVGTTRALNTVTVRSQVDGKLLKLNFTEGQDVERGFVLAEIDPTIYQAQYDQAVAKKAQDEAQLANAKLDLERYIRLAQSNAATKQQADTQRATVAQLEAQVNADQGAIDNQKAYLDYTKVVAPIAGRTGIRQVDVGNLVKATDTTGIVVITQIKPISVIFTLPQQQLAAVNKAFGAERLSVLALGTDSRKTLDRGVLQVIDNQVDSTTGTVKLKAEFPNTDLQLWPGQFVNVKLLVDTLKGVVTVPTAAVQRGPNGTFAYVVKPDDTVAVTPVTVTQQDDTTAVIATGLASGDRVVTTGFSQLADGKRVTVSTGGTPGAPADRPRRPGAPNAVAPSAGAPAAPQAEAPASSVPPPAAGTTQPTEEQRAAGERRRRTEGAGSGSTVR